MRESVPTARYSPVCNVLRQWKTSLILTHRAMTRTLFHSVALLYTWDPIPLCCIAIYTGTLFSLCCIATCIYTGTLIHSARTLSYSAALPYTWDLSFTLLHCYINWDLIPLCCIAIYIRTLFPLCFIAIYTRTLFYSAALLYTWDLSFTRRPMPLGCITTQSTWCTLHGVLGATVLQCFTAATYGHAGTQCCTLPCMGEAHC